MWLYIFCSDRNPKRTALASNCTFHIYSVPQWPNYPETRECNWFECNIQLWVNNCTGFWFTKEICCKNCLEKKKKKKKNDIYIYDTDLNLTITATIQPVAHLPLRLWRSSSRKYKHFPRINPLYSVLCSFICAFVYNLLTKHKISSVRERENISRKISQSSRLYKHFGQYAKIGSWHTMHSWTYNFYECIR